MMAERPGWRKCASLLWRLSNRSRRGRFPLEAFEDLLDELDTSVRHGAILSINKQSGRRIKPRIVRKIQRLERAMFKRAGENCGDETFFEAVETFIRLREKQLG